MTQRRANLKVIAGPNEGDIVGLAVGSCRLIGRHLAENETAFIDRDGNRLLDGQASSILGDHLKEKAPETSIAPSEAFSANAFERGADIILSDDSISRAHAMVFHDTGGIGVIDLASTNGTFVNNDRVGTAMLSDGDIITLGASKLEIALS
ncbi:MAG: FHA domain-containing protein [Myxococcota bacterium]